jgi:hypothetical protein
MERWIAKSLSEDSFHGFVIGGFPPESDSRICFCSITHFGIVRQAVGFVDTLRRGSYDGRRRRGPFPATRAGSSRLVECSEECSEECNQECNRGAQHDDQDADQAANPAGDQEVLEVVLKIVLEVGGGARGVR